MKKTARTISILLSAVLIAASFVCVWAQTAFTDVSDGYWAAQHIQNAVDAKIVSGYTDGSFRPTNNVKKQEALAMLYRMLRAASLLKSDADLSADYAAVLDGHAFSAASGLRMPAAYCLENGILNVEDLELSGNAQAAAPRELIAVWTAKAMGYAVSPLSVLPFNDTASMESVYMPYVDALYRNGIMLGGSDGNFSPKNGVVRAEMAAIAVRLLNAAPGAVLTPQKKEDALVQFTGTVTAVNTARRTLALSCKDGTKTLYLGYAHTLLLDGDPADIAALSDFIGSEVSFSCVIGGADTVVVQTCPRVESGTVEEVTALDDCTRLTVSLRSGATASYIYDARTTEGYLPAAGQDVVFISDGSLLLEMQ